MRFDPVWQSAAGVVERNGIVGVCCSGWGSRRSGQVAELSKSWEKHPTSYLACSYISSF